MNLSSPYCDRFRFRFRFRLRFRFRVRVRVRFRFRVRVGLMIRFRVGLYVQYEPYNCHSYGTSVHTVYQTGSQV